MIGSVLGTDYVGVLTIAANTFKVGDSFNLKLSGNITCSNGDEVSIDGYNNFGTATQSILFTAGPTTLDSLTAGYWELEMEFTVRGINGVGLVLSSGNFGQFPSPNSGNTIDGVGFNTTSVIDTTVDNTISVRYTGNIALFNCSQAILTKIY